MKKGGQDKKEDRHRPREPNATKRSIGLSIEKAVDMYGAFFIPEDPTGGAGGAK